MVLPTLLHPSIPAVPRKHASMRRRFGMGLLLILQLCIGISAAHADGFDVVALGVKGGLDNGDLSSYLIRAQGDRRYLALDAGTLLPGIRQALRHGAFADIATDGKDTTEGRVYRDLIAGYFISHAHLDHVAGLLIAATDDVGHKPVYALASTNEALSRDYFNWSAWPNFADRGEAPALGRYLLTDEPAGQSFKIADTALTGTIYPLSHDRVVSSMLLLKSGDDYFAYFGDTGPDALSNAHRLAAIWQVLGPLVRRHALKGLLIETSFPNDVPDKLLFGHLTPAWLLRELHALEQAAGGIGSLKGLPVLIGHIKPSLAKDRDPRALIAAQLDAGNTLGIRFVLPQQGDLLHLP
jgi:3',5'-cyclic-nucleotide phosphodiesterase